MKDDSSEVFLAFYWLSLSFIFRSLVLCVEHDVEFEKKKFRVSFRLVDGFEKKKFRVSFRVVDGFRPLKLSQKFLREKKWQFILADSNWGSSLSDTYSHNRFSRHEQIFLIMHKFRNYLMMPTGKFWLYSILWLIFESVLLINHFACKGSLNAGGSFLYIPNNIIDFFISSSLLLLLHQMYFTSV